MHRTLRLLGIPVLLLAFCACASTPLGRPIDPPEVYLVNVVPQGAGMLEQTLRLDLRIENPNNFDVSIEGISLNLDLNGKHFATARSTLDVLLPRLASENVSIEGRASTLDLLNQVQGLGSLRRISYSMEGKLFLDELGVRGLPFQRSADFGLSLP